jgi:integrase
MRGRGEGSVYKRKDGTHQAAISTRTGRVYVTRKKAESYEAFLARVEKAKAEARKGLDTKNTTGEFLTEWLASVKPTIRPKSYESYEGTVRLYLVPAIGTVPLAKLTPSHVNEAMAFARKLKRSPRTIAYVRSILRRALHVAQRWGLVDRNVAALVDAPRVEKFEFAMPGPDAWDEFLHRVSGTEYEALLLIMALMGPRRGEALALYWSDYDGSTLRFLRALQRVTGEGLVISPVKTATSRRTVPVPAIVVEALKRWRVRQLEWKLAAGEFWQDSDFMFTNRTGKPISPEMAREIGMRVWPHRLHDLRHVAASHLLAEGEPLEIVSTLLGHSSIRMTKDVYGHVPTKSLERAAERMQAIGTRKKR